MPCARRSMAGRRAASRSRLMRQLEIPRAWAYRLEAAVTDSILIGRERELADVEAALAAAQAGGGGVLLVAGEAGVGKTRLATHALAVSGLRILAGEAVEGAMSPYGPVVAA